MRARLAGGAALAPFSTAALRCVRDNVNPVGTSAWNPYADRVRTIVLRNGVEAVTAWFGDFRREGRP